MRNRSRKNAPSRKLENALNKLRTWSRHVDETERFRFVTFRQRLGHIRVARLYLANAERIAKGLRR